MKRKRPNDKVEPTEIKETLEEYLQEYNSIIPPNYTISSPTITKTGNKTSINHRITSESINKGNTLDIFELFGEYYSSQENQNSGILIRTHENYIANHLEFLPSKEEPEKSERRHVTLATQFSPGSTKVKNGELKRIEPNIQMSFYSEFITVRDITFNKEIYDAVITNEKEPKNNQNKALEELIELGVIYDPDITNWGWDVLAGYKKTKEELTRRIVRPNLRKDLFDRLFGWTRKNPNQKSYNCFLLSGKPGTGKTESAKVIANQLGYNFLELRLQSIMTKWYGESEKKLGQVFDLARKVGDTVLFLDEIDCFAGNRDHGMHESSQRLLSVLMTNTAKTKLGEGLVVIAATNKEGALDDAVKRRFSKEIRYPMPDYDDRVAIYAHYAKHLDDEVLQDLASKSTDFSPFDILTVCSEAEEKYIEDVCNGKQKDTTPPGSEYYQQSAKKLLKARTARDKKIGFS